MILNRREFMKKISFDTENLRRMEKVAYNKNMFREQQFEKALQTYGQIKSHVCEDKQGQYLDQQLSHIEQEQIMQKELNELKLHHDLKSKQQTQIYSSKSKNSSKNNQSQQMRAIKYHFIRKQVICTSKTNDEFDNLQKTQDSFFENSSYNNTESKDIYDFYFQNYFRSIEINEMQKISNNDKLNLINNFIQIIKQGNDNHRKSKLETISSMDQSYSFGNSVNESFTNKLDVTKDQILDQELTQSQKQIQYYLKRMSVMSASLDIRKNLKTPLIELDYQNRTPKTIKSKMYSQFNDQNLNISDLTFDSQQNDDRKSQAVDVTKYELQTNFTTELKRIQKKKDLTILQSEKQNEKDNQIKELIDQELSHHSFFLTKRRNKTTENLFFKNLDEKLLSNKNGPKYYWIKSKPIVQIKELFTMKEKRLSIENKKSQRNQESSQQHQEEYKISPPITTLQQSLLHFKNSQKDHFLNSSQDEDNNNNIKDLINIQSPSHSLFNPTLFKNSITPKPNQGMINLNKNRAYTIRESQSFLKDESQREISFAQMRGSLIIKNNVFGQQQQNSNQNNLNQTKFSYQEQKQFKTEPINIMNKRQIQLSHSISNGFLNKSISNSYSIPKGYSSGINNIIQTPTSIRKELSFNESTQKLPLKYFSSQIKNFNEEIQTKSRKIVRNLTFQQLNNSINISNIKNIQNKTLDLSICGKLSAKPK